MRILDERDHPGDQRSVTSAGLVVLLQHRQQGYGRGNQCVIVE